MTSGRPNDEPSAGAVERRARNLSGRMAEIKASIALRLKGYRILGRRVRTGAGEIDLIAVRRQRLSFVEVKLRATMANAEASISSRQRQRVRRAAELWLARQPAYHGYEQSFDIVFVLPRRWPVHLPGAL